MTARERADAARLTAIAAVSRVQSAAADLALSLSFSDDVPATLAADAEQLTSLARRCLTPVQNAAAAIAADNAAGDTMLGRQLKGSLDLLDKPVTAADLAHMRLRLAQEQEDVEPDYLSEEGPMEGARA